MRSTGDGIWNGDGAGDVAEEGGHGEEGRKQEGEGMDGGRARERGSWGNSLKDLHIENFVECSVV